MYICNVSETLLHMHVTKYDIKPKYIHSQLLSDCSTKLKTVEYTVVLNKMPSNTNINFD